MSRLFCIFTVMFLGMFFTLSSNTSQVFANERNTAYVLGPQDKIKVIIYGEDDISDTYGIDGKGFVSMPLIGEVLLSGLTLRDAERLISSKFSDGYLVDPSVAIEVVSHRPFYILGEVREPGSYPYVDNISVLKAVALAGGFTYRANQKRVEILRNGAAQSEVYKKVPVDAQVRPGDTITVKERFF